jgi:hypothetical protein
MLQVQQQLALLELEPPVQEAELLALQQLALQQLALQVQELKRALHHRR